jgi:hypothetical protein
MTAFSSSVVLFIYLYRLIIHICNIEHSNLLPFFLEFMARPQKQNYQLTCKASNSFINFPVGSQLEHRAPFAVSVISHTFRHTVGLFWTRDQPVAETSTYIGQQNKKSKGVPLHAMVALGRRGGIAPIHS